MATDRIVIKPGLLGGKPSIRGMRIGAATILGFMDEGFSDGRILDLFPDLEPADLDAVRDFYRDR